MTAAALRAIMLTPAGRGAIACVRIEGEGTSALVAQHFTKAGRGSSAAMQASALERALDRPIYGYWQFAPSTTGVSPVEVPSSTLGVSPVGAPLEVPLASAPAPAHREEVVLRMISPSACEFTSHGGPAVVRAILRGLTDSGAIVEAWPDYIHRTTADPIQAAATIALAAATTERTARVLLVQYHGALRQAFMEIDEAIARGDLAAAMAMIDALRARHSLGLHLTQPWQVVLVGRPNVGKSSLINALVGYERAIAHHEPGTTRDIVTAFTAIDGWPIELSDTAGLRETTDPLEAQGVARSRQQLAEADLVIEVVAVSDGEPAGARLAIDTEIPQPLRIANKIDLANGQTLPAGTQLGVSAVTRAGIDDLLQAIVARLVPDPTWETLAMPFTLEQGAGLERARALLLAGETQPAREVLARCHNPSTSAPVK